MQIMSVVLNIILLVGALTAIAFIIKGKQRNDNHQTTNKDVELGNIDTLYNDDIIAVRKSNGDENSQAQELKAEGRDSALADGPIVIMYLVAQPGDHFVGYELLQALLSNGMRYGDMNLFHRHQEVSGKGPVLFSLANASEEGTFEIQKMGAFSAKGLCLFMHLSGNNHIDGQRFDMMLSTAKQLASDLKGLLLDENQQKITEDTIANYHQQIKPQELEEAVF